MMDNLDLFEMHDAQREKEATVYPVCDYCGERIFDDFLYAFDGEIICESCFNDAYRKPTDNYIKERYL